MLIVTLLILISYILQYGRINYHLNNLKYIHPKRMWYIAGIFPLAALIVLYKGDGYGDRKLKGKQPYFQFKLLKRSSEIRLKDTYNDT